MTTPQILGLFFVLAVAIVAMCVAWSKLRRGSDHGKPVVSERFRSWVEFRQAEFLKKFIIADLDMEGIAKAVVWAVFSDRECGMLNSQRGVDECKKAFSEKLDTVSLECAQWLLNLFLESDEERFHGAEYVEFLQARMESVMVENQLFLLWMMTFFASADEETELSELLNFGGIVIDAVRRIDKA